MHELLALQHLKQEGHVFREWFGDRYSIFKGYTNDLVECERLAGPLAKESLSEAGSHLLHYAKAYFKTVRAEDFTIQNPSTLSSHGILRNLLIDQGFPGLIIGEKDHAQTSSKQFIIDHLVTLKEAGVKTLWIEHLSYDGLQKLLDDYCHSPDADMPLILENYLHSLDAKWEIPVQKVGFMALVAAAKKAGLKIAAIDTEASYHFEIGIEAGSTQKRLMVMNYMALERMKKEPHEGKFIIFTGLCHASTFCQVPGLAQLLRCPAIAIADSQREGIALNVQHYGMDQEQFQGTLHVLIEK